MENINEQKSKRDRQRRIQQREDDDEEFQVVGDSHRTKTSRSSARSSASKLSSPLEMGNFKMGAFGMGLAALGLGAAALYKTYFSKDTDDSTTYSTSPEMLTEQLREVEKDIEEYPVIGLDCQWTQNTEQPLNRNPVALLQLATSKGHVILFPFNKFSSIPATLKSLLRNEHIIKTGIEVASIDAKYLLEDYNLEVKSTFDLRFLAEDTGNLPEGLEKMAKKILDVDLPHRGSLLSNWDGVLERDQLDYAENVVKASIELFKTLYSYTGLNTTKEEIFKYCSPNLDKKFSLQSD